MPRVLQVVLLALIVSAICVTIVVIAATPLRAHSWYDSGCCDSRDCAPLPDGAVVATVDGYDITLRAGDHPLVSQDLFIHIPYGDMRILPSQDGRFHGCVFGTPAYRQFRCFYVPGAGA
jgi:hypothetical protein